MTSWRQASSASRRRAHIARNSGQNNIFGPRGAHCFAGDATTATGTTAAKALRMPLLRAAFRGAGGDQRGDARAATAHKNRTNRAAKIKRQNGAKTNIRHALAPWRSSEQNKRENAQQNRRGVASRGHGGVATWATS